MAVSAYEIVSTVSGKRDTDTACRIYADLTDAYAIITGLAVIEMEACNSGGLRLSENCSWQCTKCNRFTFIVSVAMTPDKLCGDDYCNDCNELALQMVEAL